MGTPADDIVIVAARRSPVGSLNGALSPLQAHEISAQVIRATLDGLSLDPAHVEETILGQVLTAGAGMNPARQAARQAGIPDSSPAMNVSQVCGSGLRAVAIGAQQIMTGDARTVVAGGQESMSNAPHVAHLRKGKKLGDMALTDTILRDGLTDIFYGYHMGITAENVAEQEGISRQAQDAFALQSQSRASKASRNGDFSREIVPITVPARKAEMVVSADEHIRHDTSAEALVALKPVFKPDGTVTAGNASGINDGAAAVVLMSAREAARQEREPMATIRSWAQCGLDPSIMGLGPIDASRKALARARWSMDQVDIWEINEAFAAQSLAVTFQLGLDPKKVNPSGGAIALGHPIGASGARILVTLVHGLQRRGGGKGVATLCIGGGMGIAMCIESGK